MFIGQRCTYESMFRLPYLFFILLRSSKSISFTLGAFIIGQFFKTSSKISAKDLIYTGIITAGLIMFNLDVISSLMKDGKKSDKTLEIVTLVISIVGLVIESIAGFFQQEVRAEINPSTFQLMFLTSFFIGLSSLVVWISSGEVFDTVALYSYSNQAFFDQLMVSALSCFGNIFVFMLLSRRGPIAVALVTTTRKVFSVLLSIHTGSEAIAPLKGVGIAIVVVGVILESLSGILSSKPHNQSRHGNHHHPKKQEDEAKPVEVQTDKQSKANGNTSEASNDTKTKTKKDR